jgi:hypothetical protein
MSEFTVTMGKAEGISEEEQRRRIHQAYSILLDAARRAGERQDTEKDQQQGGVANDR